MAVSKTQYKDDNKVYLFSQRLKITRKLFGEVPDGDEVGVPLDFVSNREFSHSIVLYKGTYFEWGRWKAGYLNVSTTRPHSKSTLTLEKEFPCSRPLEDAFTIARNFPEKDKTDERPYKRGESYYKCKYSLRKRNCHHFANELLRLLLNGEEENNYVSEEQNAEDYKNNE